MNYADAWDYTISKINQELETKGWTREKLAHNISMDNANLSRILSGVQTNMEYKTLFKIAEALKVSMSELVK